MCGMVAGSALTGFVAPRFHSRSLFVLGTLVIQSLVLGAFAATSQVSLALLALFVFGILDASVIVVWTTYLQTIVPKSMMGRVFGTMETVAQLIVPGGQALGGLAGQVMALGPLYTGIAWVRGVCPAVYLLTPSFRRAFDQTGDAAGSRQAEG